MKTAELWEFDRAFGPSVAGMDEAGRGPLAGPVVCACCLPKTLIDGVNDSKKIAEKKRERLFESLISTEIYGVGIVDEKRIDEINILNATKEGMETAFKNMGTIPDIVLIDAVKGLRFPCPDRAIVKGDATSYAIAAASVIAKVTRDRIMREYDEMYPQYGFAAHKGYGTAVHIAALKKYGPCPIHRRSFIGHFV